MKKPILAVALLSLSLSTLISCKKDEPTAPTNTNTTNNSNNTGNNNTNQNWNWKGTAPFSAKLNGIKFLGDEDSYGRMQMGMLAVIGRNESDTSFSVTIMNTPTSNTEYNAPTPGNFGVSIFGEGTWQALSGGKIKIISYSTSSVEGMFYGTLKEVTGKSSGTITVTEGYFKVDMDQ